MKAFVLLLVSIIAFSCQTNHYLSEPIKGYPNIGLQSNLNSKGILVATNYNLSIDTSSFENCLEGLKLNVELQSKLKVIDEILFNKCPDTAILMELKAKYNVDGLLLLTKLRMQKKWYEVPSRRLYFFPAFHDIVDHPSYYSTKPWTNLYVKIISQWEYHDFTTGKSFEYRVENDKVYEFDHHVADIDLFLEENYKLFDPLLYQNGKIAAYNFVGAKYYGFVK